MYSYWIHKLKKFQIFVFKINNNSMKKLAVNRNGKLQMSDKKINLVQKLKCPKKLNH